MLLEEIVVGSDTEVDPFAVGSSIDSIVGCSTLSPNIFFKLLFVKNSSLNLFDHKKISPIRCPEEKISENLHGIEMRRGDNEHNSSIALSSESQANIRRNASRPLSVNLCH